jgi:transposase
MLKNANFSNFKAVYIVCGHVDLRYGIDSLAALVEGRYHMQMFTPDTLFLFCGRNSNKIKGLLWEGDGFLLLYKRVEKGHFIWPRNSEDIRDLSAEQFRNLMYGFSIDPLITDVSPTHSA